MTILLWVIAFAVATVIVITKNWPLWTIIPATVGVVIVAHVLWWAVKTAVAIAAVLAVLFVIGYGVWWVYSKPATSKK